jgi:hypothetical protein
VKPVAGKILRTLIGCALQTNYTYKRALAVTAIALLFRSVDPTHRRVLCDVIMSVNSVADRGGVVGAFSKPTGNRLSRFDHYDNSNASGHLLWVVVNDCLYIGASTRARTGALATYGIPHRELEPLTGGFTEPLDILAYLQVNLMEWKHVVTAPATRNMMLPGGWKAGQPDVHSAAAHLDPQLSASVPLVPSMDEDFEEASIAALRNAAIALAVRAQVQRDITDASLTALPARPRKLPIGAGDAVYEVSGATHRVLNGLYVSVPKQRDASNTMFERRVGNNVYTLYRWHMQRGGFGWFVSQLQKSSCRGKDMDYYYANEGGVTPPVSGWTLPDTKTRVPLSVTRVHLPAEVVEASVVEVTVVSGQSVGQAVGDDEYAYGDLVDVSGVEDLHLPTPPTSFPVPPLPSVPLRPSALERIVYGGHEDMMGEGEDDSTDSYGDSSDADVGPVLPQDGGTGTGTVAGTGTGVTPRVTPATDTSSMISTPLSDGLNATQDAAVAQLVEMGCERDKALL